MYARKVLIVEDHQESRESLATVLKKARFDVLEAGSLKTAFAMTSDGQVAAIVSELKLSDGNGLSLLASPQKKWPGMSHRFCLSLWNYEFRDSGHEDGRGGFLDKACHCKRSD